MVRTRSKLFQARVIYVARAVGEGCISYKAEIAFPHEPHMILFVTSLLLYNHPKKVYPALNCFRCSRGLRNHGKNQWVMQIPALFNLLHKTSRKRAKTIKETSSLLRKKVTFHRFYWHRKLNVMWQKNFFSRRNVKNQKNLVYILTVSKVIRSVVWYVFCNKCNVN